MISPSAQRTQALLMLLVANLFWGLSFPVIKAVVLVHEQVLPGSGNWFITAMTVGPRFVIALAILAVLQGRRLVDINAREFRQGAALGLFAAVGMILQNDGLQFTEASTSAFLTQFYAIMIPVYLALRRRRNPGLRVWGACALVLAGVAILGRFNWTTLDFGRGEGETLLASLFFMGQILWLERPEFAGNRPEKITVVMFATQAAAFVLLTLLTAPSLAAIAVPFTSPAWLGLTLTLTLFCTIGSFTIMNTFQPRISATEAGLIYCVEPVFGSLFALFLPGLFSIWAGIAYGNETATWTLLVGGSLITVANLLIQLKPTKATAAQAA